MTSSDGARRVRPNSAIHACAGSADWRQLIQQRRWSVVFVQFLTRKMVIFTCAIKSCRRKGTFGDGNSTRNSGFFRFPGHPRIREIWYKNTGIKPEDINTCTRICEIHFVESDFCRTLETKVIGKTLRFEKKRLKFSAAPTLHLDKTVSFNFHFFKALKIKNVKT